MQAFAPVIGFSLPEHQARNRLRMAADFQVFSSDLQFLTYPVPAQLQAIVVALATKVCYHDAGRLAGLLETEWPQGQPNDAYAQYFVGKSYIQRYEGVSNVTFEPRCRNNWHIHHGAVQVLICVSGRGWYQEWNKPAIPLTLGMVIAIPEGVKHWHGAATDSWMQHLALHTAEQPNASNEWLEPVSEEQYDQLPKK